MKSFAQRPDWIEKQLIDRGIHDDKLLRLFAQIPREDFIPKRHRKRAYDDGPLAIGCRQTISQPYVVALSILALELTGSERVLDVGTGSGYLAVLLSYLSKEVYTVEVQEQLHLNARLPIEIHGKAPIHRRLGDGSLGWAERAPFDAIVVGARSPRLPPSLADQLGRGGRMVIPIGGDSAQQLFQYRKKANGELEESRLGSVLFVPLVGEEGV